METGMALSMDPVTSLGSGAAITSLSCSAAAFPVRPEQCQCKQRLMRAWLANADDRPN